MRSAGIVAVLLVLCVAVGGVQARPFNRAPDACEGFTRPDPHVQSGEFVYYGPHDEIVEVRGQVSYQGWEMGPLVILRQNEGSESGPCLAQYYRATG